MSTRILCTALLATLRSGGDIGGSGKQPWQVESWIVVCNPAQACLSISPPGTPAAAAGLPALAWVVHCCVLSQGCWELMDCGAVAEEAVQQSEDGKAEVWECGVGCNRASSG